LLQVDAHDFWHLLVVHVHYISSTYNSAAEEQRNAVGFVMTIYRRRLASSFRALAKTLQGRGSEKALSVVECLQLR
jgi:hypothetical protein